MIEQTNKQTNTRTEITSLYLQKIYKEVNINICLSVYLYDHNLWTDLPHILMCNSVEWFLARAKNSNLSGLTFIVKT